MSTRSSPRLVTVHTVELADRLVPDDLWDAVAPLLPPGGRPRPQGGGRRRHDDRTILVAIIYVLTSGVSWRSIPPWCGVTTATAYRRFRAWTDADVWTRLGAARPDDEWCQVIVEHAMAYQTTGTDDTGGDDHEQGHVVPG